MTMFREPPPALAADQSIARGLLSRRVAAKRPNVVLASAYVPPDGAVACYLLHRLLSHGDRTGVRWHSVFVNSGVESLGTVTKYVRNRTNRDGDGHLCQVLVLDPTGTAGHAFGHAVAGLRSLVDDGMTIVDSADEFRTHAGGSWDAAVVVADGLADGSLADVADTLRDMAERGTTTAAGILYDEPALQRMCEQPPRTDLVFLGEVCVGGQLPCGTVSFTREAFALWNNVTDSFAHVSTFGGNGVALELLCDRLAGLRPLDAQEQETAERIRRNPVVRRARLRMHANSWQTRSIDAAGMNITFDRADGVTYVLGDKRYVDLAAGTGTAFRGHNRQSPDMIAAAGTTTTGNEIRLLEEKLADLTGLPVLLPAVSGASAVDNAILAALHARPGRGAVVTLRGNFSGKGPMSLAVSRTSPFFRDLDDNAFRPYPVDVVEVDVDDLDGLRAILRRKDIALVWMEAVLGFDCVDLPRPVLDEIASARESSGYLVGFDEIFSGFWRCDPQRFLGSERYALQPDLVALSKGLSDALIPIGATVMTDAVYDDVAAAAPEAAKYLRSHYRSDLSAALALAALEYAEHHRDTGPLQDAMESAFARATTSSLFTGYRRVGLLGKLEIAPPPVPVASMQELMTEYAEAMTARIIAKRCGVIPLQMRFSPCTAGEHTDELVNAFESLGAFLERMPRRRLYRTMMTTGSMFTALEVAATVVSVWERLRDTRRRRSIP